MIQVLILIFSVATYAEEPTFVYEIGNSMILFTKREQMVINKSCGTSCLAYQKGKVADSFKVDSKDLVGGKNPSSVRCKKHLSGVVVIGRDDDENQQSFCLFPDGSYLKN